MSNLSVINFREWRERYPTPATEQAVRMLCELHGLTLRRKAAAHFDYGRESFEMLLPDGKVLVTFYCNSPIERFIQAVTNWKRTGTWRD